MVVGNTSGGSGFETIIKYFFGRTLSILSKYHPPRGDGVGLPHQTPRHFPERNFRPSRFKEFYGPRTSFTSTYVL